MTFNFHDKVFDIARDPTPWAMSPDGVDRDVIDIGDQFLKYMDRFHGSFGVVLNFGGGPRIRSGGHNGKKRVQRVRLTLPSQSGAALQNRFSP